MKIAALLFDRLTVLDIVGPIEALSWAPDAEIVYVGKRKGQVRAVPTGLGVEIDHTLDEVRAADVLIVPGGPGVRALLDDRKVLDWVRTVHETTQWTTSVCTGSLLLGAAGLLDGLEATTHWNAAAELEATGARYSEKRVIPQGKIVTAAGVSSGIDMALWLLGRMAGDDVAEAAQLCIEYDPQPPYDTGAPSKAGEAVITKAREVVAAIVARAKVQAAQ